MEERKKPNFKRHTLPPVSRWYLFRIVFYVVLLIVLCTIIYATIGFEQDSKVDKNLEIDGVLIELEAS